MREKTCCFTGHRTVPEHHRDTIAISLQTEIQRLVLSGYRYFGAGGALGFDTMAAQAVLSLKSDFPHIKLILVLPCKDQAEKWKPADQIVYENIKSQADKVVYMAEHYAPGRMFQRDRHLVDHSSICLCYLTHSHGGTAYTVDYAKKVGVPIKNLAPQ